MQCTVYANASPVVCIESCDVVLGPGGEDLRNAEVLNILPHSSSASDTQNKQTDFYILRLLFFFTVVEIFKWND